MTELLISFFVSMIITAAAGALLIPFLRRLKFGQSILEIGPKWHMSKQGTPTMGGLMFIIGITASALIVGWRYISKGEVGHLFVLIFSLCFGVIGFVDDFFKIIKKRNLGLTTMQKLILQITMAIAFVAVLRYFGYLSSRLYVPFFNVSIELNWIFYSVFSAFVIVATVNSVNLSDGADGLAAGVTFPVAVFFSIVAYQMKMPSAAILASALAGGLIGFLIYNFHPAKVFMGDTGSLFLGGAVCGLAFACDMPLIIVVVGLVYLVEALSDIIQVLYFKATGGKRIFRMAPIHHHFEMGGWSEKRLFLTFSGVTAIMCAVGYLGVSGRL